MDNKHQFVGAVIGETFRIPKYQRGYRWTEENVLKLLEDIYEDRLYLHDKDDDLITESATNIFKGISFKYDDQKFIFKEPKSPYCIQPLVVMKTHKGYDVIDGQQRLTTISIIRAALNKIGGLGITPSNLSYESRTDSQQYIEYLYTAKERPQGNNIDFAYMEEAYGVAIEYYTGLLEGKFVSDEIKKKYASYLDDVICKNTQFIWYCVESNDPQKVFANFNTGKIELTNSELIKALFMNPSSYSSASVKDKQIVISEKWDEIENKLHESDFWAFVPHPLQYEENAKQYSTRIDVLFDFLVMEIWLEKHKEKTIDAYIKHRNTENSDKYIFNQIEEWLKEVCKEPSDDMMERCWHRVGKIFSGLKELYWADNRIYNMVGLYINLKNRDINKVDGYITDNETYLDVYNTLRNILLESRNKREELLKREIKTYLNKDIKLIQYNEGRPYEIIKTLIIYNIALINSSKGTGERYNFLANANNQWEREHIFACNVKETVSDKKERIGALEVLADDSYIEYAKHLFAIGEKEIYFLYENTPYTLNLVQLDETVAQNFINSNLAYDGNGQNEILARALKAKKDATSLLSCYDNIDKLESINFETALDMKQTLSYLYLKQLEGKLYNLENVDIRQTASFETTIREINSKEIHFAELHFTYTNREYDEYKENWSNWLNKISVANSDDKKPKTNYDILADKIVDSYQNKLQGILYDKNNQDSLKQEDNIFNNENASFIFSALKLSIITLNSRITTFFDEDFPRLLKDNSMGNMTLLTGNKKQTDSSGQNQVVSNKSYSAKKDMVYNFFKQGQFVPIGTLLVFTDVYTKGTNTANYWLPDSRLAYIQDMDKTISAFLGEEDNKCQK